MTGLKQLSILFSGLRGLPAGIGKLTCLRSLDQFWVAGNHNGSYSSSSSSSSSSPSNIWELGDLHHLHGFLKISNMDMVTSGEEATRAQLYNKNSLSSLVRAWNTDGRGRAKEKTTREDVVHALCPCPTLLELWIQGYLGCTVPTWLRNSTALMLSGLQKLGLQGWDGCTNLPALGNLPKLR